MQNNQERFMVRTSKIVDDRYVYENRLVDGRPMTIKQIESVGVIHREDHDFVRNFLEGMELDTGMAEVYVRTHGNETLAIAKIFQIR